VIDYNTLVVLAGVSVLGACAGLVGTFAVLRRRALTGDAVSHAALPGVCVAFLVVGERRLPVLLFGAFLSGLLGAMTISALRRWTRIKEDAAVGIVLSVFVGAGFALSRIIQSSVTGGSKAGLNSYILGKTAGMIAQDVYLISTTALLCLVLVVLLYKEFKLVSFDPGFARVQGWPAQVLDLLLMALLAATVVIGLPAVGAVLMAALLILPAATARLWTDRLGTMLLLAGAFGAATGAAGTFLSSSHEKLPAGPVIVLVGASFFLASLFLAPRRGLVSGLLARLRFERDLQERYLLRVLFDLVEPHLREGKPPENPVVVSFDDLLRQRSWSRARLARLLASAVRKGYLERSGPDRYTVTEAGLRRAAEVARGHRLWALFLTEYADLAAGTANLAEESVESLLSPDMVADLHRKLEQQDRMPAVHHPEASG
jgi:manganese/zinc/iron transport system permease protein